MRNSFSRFALAFVASQIITASPSVAQTFEVPANAALTEHQATKSASQRFPVGVFAGADTKVISAQGRVDHQAYTLTSTSLTTLQLLTPLQAQFESFGYKTRFACADTVCGGFDFRFLLTVLPEPKMHVDLGDFQYLVAEHPDGRIVAVLTSRARTTGFIQITTVRPQARSISDQSAQQNSTQLENDPTASTPPIAQIAQGPIAQDLQSTGSVVLEDLDFKTGSSALGVGPFVSLKTLADFIIRTAGTEVVLVGHTDAMGGLPGNISLSKKRASSVRERLIKTYNVPAAQLRAEGVGYLAPRARNDNDVGREKNRRVEAVLASTP
jgi:outer membrane protein OmpA-like peptidoglycan-associated protein